MARNRIKPRLLVLMIAGLMLSCLAGPASGDDVQYLPDNPYKIDRMDLAPFVKTKTFAEMKGMFDSEGIGGLGYVKWKWGTLFGVPFDNISHVVVVLTHNEEQTAICTSIKPATIADVKKATTWEKDDEWKEIRVKGSPFWVLNVGKNEESGGYGIVDPKVVIGTKLATVKTVLERDRPAELAADLKAALKEYNATEGKIALFYVDMAKTPENRRPPLLKFPGAEKLAENVQSVTIICSEATKVKIQYSAVCKETPGAAEVKKRVETALAKFKNELPDNPKALLHDKELRKALVALLDSVEVTTKGNRVTATATLEPVQAARLLGTSLHLEPKREK